MEVMKANYIQDWMNLFYFLTNKPNDKYDKALKFIQLVVYSPKRVKFRDTMCKKKTMNIMIHSLHVEVTSYKKLLYILF